MFVRIGRQLYLLSSLMAFVSYILCVDHFSNTYRTPHCTVDFPIELDKTYFDHHKSYGVRGLQSHYHNYQSSHYFNSLSEDLQNIAGEYDVLNNYTLYVSEAFCAYARTLPCYEEFIFCLNEKIKNDKNFRKKTACIRGFYYSFSWGTETSGFHDFVRDEVHKLQAQQKKSNNRQGGLYLDDFHSLDAVIKDCTIRLQGNSDNHRLVGRIKAIDNTRKQQYKIFDYSSQVSWFKADDCYAKEFSNTYGTQLDCQLHKELYESRSAMMQLEQMFYYNHHIQALASLIHYSAAQAKMEKNPSAAFKLSDFCYTITQFLAHGMYVLYDGSCAVGKGVWKGAKEFVNPERWRDMVTGSLHLARFFIDAVDHVEELDRAMNGTLFSEDSNTLRAAEEKCRLHAQVHMNAIRQGSQQTYQRIGAMSWQELVENGTEIGTTMILDTLALHALSKFTCLASGSLAKHFNNALESGALITEQYAIEVAGFGKLIIEEGLAVPVIAADSIKNDFTFFAKNINPVSQQIKCNLSSSKLSENIVHTIRNVGDDILDIMEKAGGHTLKEHVSKTYEDLLLRALRGKPTTISTFANKRIAINAVKENLKNNAKEIASWLASNPSQNSKKAFDFVHSYDIGEGILKGKKNGLCSLIESRVVLVPNSTNEFGFEIVTAFPVV